MVGEEEILDLHVTEDVDDGVLDSKINRALERKLGPILAELKALKARIGKKGKGGGRKGGGGRITDKNDPRSIMWWNYMNEIEKYTLVGKVPPAELLMAARQALDEGTTPRKKHLKTQFNRVLKQAEQLYQNELKRTNQQILGAENKVYLDATTGNYIKPNKDPLNLPHMPGRYGRPGSGGLLGDFIPVAGTAGSAFQDAKDDARGPNNIPRGKGSPYFRTLFPPNTSRDRSGDYNDPATWKNHILKNKKNRASWNDFWSTFEGDVDRSGTPANRVWNKFNLKTLGKGALKIGASSGGIGKNPWGLMGFGLGQLSRLGVAGAAIAAAVGTIVGSVHFAENTVKFLGEKGYPLNRDFYRLADDHAYGMWSVEEEKRRLLGHDAYVITQTDRYQPDSGSTTYNSLENRDDVILSKIGLAEKAVGIDYQGWTS